MKSLIVLSAALALSACNQRADTTAQDTPTATGTTAMAPSPMANQPATGSMAGKYEAVMADGTKMTSTINPDGTYVDLVKGKEIRGTWRMNGAKSCFDPNGPEGETCLTTGAVNADGSFTATADDGTTQTVRKVGAAPTM